MNPLVFAAAKISAAVAIPKLFNEAWDYIAKQINECCEDPKPIEPGRKYFCQTDYNKIMDMRAEWEVANTLVGYKDRKSIQDLVDETNLRLGMNKSVVSYREVWFGRLKKENMLPRKGK